MKSRKKKNVPGDHLTVTRRITRSVSLRDGRENSLPIPIEIIIIIFSKLDLKSIAICRCVSKLWASILRRSDFTDLILSMSSSRGPKLLFGCKKDGEMCLFSSPQPENLDENSSLVVSNYQTKFSFDAHCYIQSDLVHGLMCLRDMRFKDGAVKRMIFNPSTGQTLFLPNLKSDINRVWTLFGYDPIGKQFKILSLIKRPRDYVVYDEYQVLTLGTVNMSWRTIESGIPDTQPHKMICINGVLYYTSISFRTETCIVVCFDVRFEKFSSIKTNETINEAIFYRRQLNITPINYNGKFGLILCGRVVNCALFNGSSAIFKLWVIEDVEKEEWSEHTFKFSTMPENVLGKDILRFVGVTQKKEIVLSSSYPSVPFYLFYLNLEKKTIVRVEIRGNDVFQNGIEYIFLDHIEDVKLF